MNINDFGKNLQNIRINKNITQEQLALKAGIAVSQIGRIERNEINPGLVTIFSIAKGLAISPHQLFCIDNKVVVETKDINLIIEAITELALPLDNLKREQLELNSPIRPVLDLIHELKKEFHIRNNSSEVLKEVMVNCNMGYWIMDVDKEEIQLCENIRDIFGFGENKNVNMTRFNKIIHAKDLVQFYSEIKRLIETGGTTKISVTGIDKNDNEVNILLNAKTYSQSVLNSNRLIGIIQIQEEELDLTKVVSNEIPHEITLEKFHTMLFELQHQVISPIKYILKILPTLENELMSKENYSSKKLDYLKDSVNDFELKITKMSKNN